MAGLHESHRPVVKTKLAATAGGLLILLMLAGSAQAALFISMEGDLRATADDREGLDGEINALSASVRQVFADDQGDRYIMYLQAETAHNFSDLMLHQAYGELKGPMGRWNLALGRVPMPWGLLTDWSPDRMPYTSPYDAIRMPASDNGILFHGTMDILDYGLALSQGYGMGNIRDFPGPGNLTGRLGLTPDIAGDFSFGLSLANGTFFASEHGHGRGHVTEEKRTAMALDCTLNIGRGIYRVEGGGRHTEGRWHPTLFAAADYALLPKMSAQTAGHLYTDTDDRGCGRIYAGVAFPTDWFTIRGGYEYEKTHTDIHRVVVQLYRFHGIAR